MGKKDTEKLVSRAKELSSDGEYIRLFDEEENYKELIRNTELSEAHEDGVKQGIEQGIEQGIKQGIKQGIEQGIVRGSKEKALEMARKCLDKEMNIETIFELTGLSIEEIENLK